MFIDTDISIKIQKNILLVEDEAIIAMSKLSELGKYGYNSVHALNGEKALEIIESYNEGIDLILMDIDLGKGMDGIQTAQNILQNYNIPIVFLSSHEEKEIVAKTEKITSYGYVVKSSKITVLDASIKMAFKLHDNINLRKEAVEETIKMNKLLRTTIDGVQEPIMLISTEYEILMYNEAVKDKYCMDNDIEPKYCYQISHNRTKPCSGEKHPCPLKCVKESLKPCTGIHKHVQKDGSIRLVELKAEPLFDENEKLTGIIETTHDITDQIRLESDLIASEKRFADLFNKAPLGYQSLDINGNFIEVNQAWLETLGYIRKEVIGKWFGDFLAPEFVEPFRNRFPFFKAEGKIHSEFQMIKKNGSQIFISFEGRIGHNTDGTFKQTHCILEDITSKKQAEEELMRRDQLLEATMRFSKIGGWEYDLFNETMIWTDETYRIHGFELETIPRGSTNHIEESLECYNPEDRAVIMEAFTNCCESGISYDLVFPFTTMQGESKWIRTTAEAVYVEERIVKVIGNIADITSLKKAEISAAELKKTFVHG